MLLLFLTMSVMCEFITIRIHSNIMLDNSVFAYYNYDCLYVQLYLVFGDLNLKIVNQSLLLWWQLLAVWHVSSGRLCYFFQ